MAGQPLSQNWRKSIRYHRRLRLRRRLLDLQDMLSWPDVQLENHFGIRRFRFIRPRRIDRVGGPINGNLLDALMRRPSATPADIGALR